MTPQETSNNLKLKMENNSRNILKSRREIWEVLHNVRYVKEKRTVSVSVTECTWFQLNC